MIHVDEGAPVIVQSRNYLTSQEHAAYTTDEHAVWREASTRHASFVAQYSDWIHPVYREGLQALQLSQRIPGVDELNERLAPTGWVTACVVGGIPTALLVDLISSRTLPVSRCIRRREHIDHAPGPDIIHDVLGHLPMLFSAEHRDLLTRMAAVMAKAAPRRLDDELWAANRRLSELMGDPHRSPAALADARARVLRASRELAADPSRRTRLERMYLWSVEFGLLGTVDDFKVHGAAILSAPAEFHALRSRAIQPLPYSLAVIDREYAFTELQRAYYVARDFAQLHEVLDEYEATRRRGSTERSGGACERPEPDA
jgi:phenylalanine-4-hydroxylase